MTRQRRIKIAYWLGHASLEYGGIASYALRTVRALLAASEPDCEFTLLCEADAQIIVEEIIAEAKQTVDIQILPSARGETNSWRQQINGERAQPQAENEFDLKHQSRLEFLLDDLRCDVIHFPMPTTPFPRGHVPYLVPPLLRIRTPYIVTIHDLQELRFPEYFSAAQRAIRAMHHWQTLDEARHVIVSYDHIKNDLIKYFRLPTEKISVCPIPYSSISLPQFTPNAAHVTLEKYRSLKPFILYPAQTWRHKNHVRLLRALQTVRNKCAPNLHLICTGHAGDYQKEVEARVVELNLGEATFFAGVVAQDELSWLYQHAALVVIPTEYEAGSFPLMEAMLAGAPVICSAVTSLPETIGDRRFVFDPSDVEAMSDLIVRLLTDSAFRVENIANGSRQTARLRGINSAAYFYATYRNLFPDV